jgi:hypothetical protein
VSDTTRSRAAGTSAIATTTALPLSELPALRGVARPRKTLLGWPKDLFPEALARYGRALEVLDPSGPTLSALLVYLERRGIDLARSSHEETAQAISSARGSTYLILGEEHLRHASMLEEARYSPAELAGFFNELHGTSEGVEVGERMREAVGFLRRALEAVSPGNVVLLAML